MSSRHYGMPVIIYGVRTPKLHLYFETIIKIQQNTTKYNNKMPSSKMTWVYIWNNGRCVLIMNEKIIEYNFLALASFLQTGSFRPLINTA